MNENKDLLQYLYRKNTISAVENVIYAYDAFFIRRISIDAVKNGHGKYQTLKQFVEQVDPIEIIKKQRQQRIDKIENSTYTSTPAKVETPTAVPVRPHAPALAHTHTENMLDRWMIKE